MIMRPAGEPRFDLGCFVGCVVIHDDMDIEPFRDLGIDLFEELQELDRPVTLVAFADDKPRGDIERGKQRGRTIPHIAVRATFLYVRHHQQDRLLPIKPRVWLFSSMLTTSSRYGGLRLLPAIR